MISALLSLLFAEGGGRGAVEHGLRYLFMATGCYVSRLSSNYNGVPQFVVDIRRAQS